MNKDTKTRSSPIITEDMIDAAMSSFQGIENEDGIYLNDGVSSVSSNDDYISGEKERLENSQSAIFQENNINVSSNSQLIDSTKEGDKTNIQSEQTNLRFKKGTDKFISQEPIEKLDSSYNSVNEELPIKEISKNHDTVKDKNINVIKLDKVEKSKNLLNNCSRNKNYVIFDLNSGNINKFQPKTLAQNVVKAPSLLKQVCQNNPGKSKAATIQNEEHETHKRIEVKDLAYNNTFCKDLANKESSNRIINSLIGTINQINSIQEKRAINIGLSIDRKTQSDDPLQKIQIDGTENKTPNKIDHINHFNNINKKRKSFNSDILKIDNILNETNCDNHTINENSIHSNSLKDNIVNYDDLDDDDDDDDEGKLKIDDSLEKEIENNLMAEMGLSSDARKKVFTLQDDNEVITINDDSEDADIVEVERNEADNLDKESITLYKANELEPPDIGSMVECVLENNNGDSVISNSQEGELLPNTSYEECSGETNKIQVLCPKKRKNSNIEEWVPVLKEGNERKNVQCLMKLKGKSKGNFEKKKLKIVSLHKSISSDKTVPAAVKKVSILKPSLNECAFKSQILENILPTYKSLSVVASSTTFKCVQCNDTFLLQSGLQQHMSRHSVHITYWCRVCSASINFYNRCLLLEHLRSHKQFAINIDPLSVTISPISSELLDMGLPNCITQDWTESVEMYPKESGTRIPFELKVIKNIFEIPRFKGSANELSNLNMPIESSTSINKTPSIKKGISKSLDVDIQGQNNLNDSCTENLSVNSLDRSNSESYIQIHDVYSLPSRNKIIKPDIYGVDKINVAEKSVTRRTRNLNIPATSIKEATISHVKETFSSYPTPISVLVHNNPEHRNKNDSYEEEFQNCGECGSKTLDMIQHLKGSNVSNKKTLLCKFCQKFLQSPCALKIHSRIHTKIGPFKCPECGKEFPSFKCLYPHLNYVCGHFSKVVKYNCFDCNKIFFNKMQLEAHLYSIHTNRMFKCNLCETAFYNVSSLTRHRFREHKQNDEFTLLSYHRCSICPNQLIQQGKISDHISKHASDPLRIVYAYQCPACKKIWSNKKSKTLFDMHMKKCDKVKKELEKYKDIDKESGIESVNNCVSDSIDINNRLISYQNSDNNGDVELCEKDPLCLDDWEDNIDQHILEKKIEICIVCKKEHVIILPGTDLNTQSLCCKNCVKFVDVENYPIKESNQLKNDKSTLNLNDKITHEKKRPQRSLKRMMSNEFEYERNNFTSRGENIENSSSNSSSPEGKKVIRNKNKKPKTDKTQNHNNSNFTSGLIIPEKLKNDFVCSKCDFKASNKDSFKEHVVTHRTDPNAYQCLECGLCFVVKPSFQKHLIVLHRIMNFKEYILNNNVGGPCEKKDSENNFGVDKDVGENQCSVCYSTFDSSSSLHKHFRTHGMAFLMSNHRQSKN